MTMNFDDPKNQLILGVDTHLDLHVAVLINMIGQVVCTEEFETNIKGYNKLLKWCKSFGELLKSGVEGTGTYGAGLSRFLVRNNISVYEVNRPNRARRRLRGKSDPTDAENAARAVLANEATAIPKNQTGSVEAMRFLLIARRSAVKARTQAINQVRAILVTAPDDIRERYLLPSSSACIKACDSIRSLGDSELLETLAISLRLLSKRWLELTAELQILNKNLRRITRKRAPILTQQFGVGPYVAANLLVTAGDNPERLKKESSFAALCGVSPIEASSGKVIRHRLNRGGSRVANNAIWTITQIRMRNDPRTIQYVERRTAEGMSNKEIQRCLKRYIAREVFPKILKDLTLAA
ncbi:MAG: IS110 family transposase [Gammaproteobacteria bacterium]|nr:IS110 family transposase [Gammaproteobacteria bacterium]